MAEEKKQPTNFTVPMGGRPGGPGRGPGARGQAVEKAHDKKGTFLKLIRYFRGEQNRIIVLLICVVAMAVAAVIAPRLQSQAIDSISEGRYEDLNYFLLLMLVFYGVQSLFTLFQGRFSALLSQSIVKQMRHDLFKKIDMMLSFNTFCNNRKSKPFCHTNNRT